MKSFLVGLSILCASAAVAMPPASSSETYRSVGRAVAYVIPEGSLLDLSGKESWAVTAGEAKLRWQFPAAQEGWTLDVAEVRYHGDTTSCMLAVVGVGFVGQDGAWTWVASATNVSGAKVARSFPAVAIPADVTVAIRAEPAAGAPCTISSVAVKVTP